MPLEIRELIIKVNIENSQAPVPEIFWPDPEEMKREIIQECTEQILHQIINTER